LRLAIDVFDAADIFFLANKVSANSLSLGSASRCKASHLGISDAANPRTASRHLPRGDLRVGEVLMLVVI
jgi:hypothetical protein